MSTSTKPQFKPAGEFDCCECGRHIVVIAGPVSEFHLCGACLMVPGWHEIPELRAVLDRESWPARTAP